MQEIIKEHLTRKRLIALCMMFIMILNLFSPYSLLAASDASSVPTGKPYYTIKVHDNFLDPDSDEVYDDEYSYLYYFNYLNGNTDTPDEGPHMIHIDVMLNGPITTLSETRLNLIYDNTLLTPATYVDRGRNHYYVESEEPDDFIDTKWGVTYDSSTREMAFTGSSDPGTYLATNTKYITFTFLLKEGYTLADLTEDTFTLGLNESEGTGLRIIWELSAGGIDYVDGEDYLVKEGFAASTSKSVSSITLNHGLNKTKYYTGEDLDFTGVNLTVNYDDGSSEIYDTVDKINQAVTDNIISIGEAKATSDKKCVVTAGDKTCDLTYNIATSITYDNNLTKKNYMQDETVDFAGGSVTIHYDNGDTEFLNIVTGMSNGLLVANQTKADIKVPNVTLTYIDNASTATIPLTVKDYIEKIEVTNNPTKTTYDEGDDIDLTNGTIKVTYKSGDTENISMTDTTKNITLNHTKAKIEYCETPTWMNGDLPAGTQKVSISYGEDINGNPVSVSLPNVTVNDTVASIRVASQPTNAKNKYGMAGTSLDLTSTGMSGKTKAQLEITTGSGNTVYVDITPAMLNTSSYNNHDITNVQNLPVTYAGKTTAAGQGVNIKLKDYINGITVTAPSDLTAAYDTDYDLTNVTFVKNYASGATSSTIAVNGNSSVSVTGYKKKPTASEFNANHECVETITVALNTPDDANVDELPKTDTFTVTVKDKVTGINVAQQPNSRTFDYDGAFSVTGGRIGFTYASGATSSTTLAMTDPKVSVTELDGSAVDMTPASSKFADGKCVKQLKITYTDEFGSASTDTTSLSITIKDIVDTIAIGTEPTKTFNHGDTFNVGSGTLNLTYKSGATGTIDLDDGTTIKETASGTNVNMSPSASEYTSNSLTKNITVEYSQNTVSSGTITKSVNYDITIKNNKKSIAMGTSPTKLQYNVGDTTYDLTNASGKNGYGDIIVTYQAGNTEVVSLNEASLTSLSTLTSTHGTGKTVTVTYGQDKDGTALTTSFSIDVIAKLVDSITIKTPPTKTNYVAGQSLDLTGMVIEAHYNDGTSKPITNYTASPANGTALTASDTAVTITYNGSDISTATAPTAAQPITVVAKAVDSIEITTPPSKTNYIEGQSFDSSGMVITVHYNDSSTGTINSDYASKGVTFDLSGALSTSNNSIAVSYSGKTVNQAITVSKKKVSSITVKTPPDNVNYTEGESLSLTGMVIEAHYNNGTSEITSDFTASPADGTALSTSDTAVTITYNGTDIEGATAPTVTQAIIVAGKKVSSITVKTPPTKTSYVEGQTLDLTGMLIEAHYNNGTSEITTDFTVSPAEGASLTPSNTAVTITYDGADIVGSTAPTVSQPINVVAKAVDSIEITTPPSKTNYVEGQSFDSSGMVITVYYNDSSTGTINSDYASKGVTFTPNGTLSTSDNAITVSYSDKTATQAITVSQRQVSSITVKTPPDDVNYTEGEALDLTGMVVEAHYNNGTSAITTDFTANPADGDTLQTSDTAITITYNGADIEGATAPTVTQAIVVAGKKVSSITVTTPPNKTSYVEGQSLDLTGIVVTAHYNNGTSNPITNYTISPAEGASLTPSNTTVTITYSGADIVGSTAPTVSQAITVTAKAVDSIEITTPPSKTDYIEGQSFDSSGMVITVHYNDSSTGTINSDYASKGVTFTPNGALSTSNNSIAVSYSGKTVNQAITVSQKKVSSITVKTPPDNVNYTEGESLSLTGLVIEAHYNNGTSDVITDFTASPADGTALSTSDTAVTITYNGTDIEGATAPTVTQAIVVAGKKVDSITVTTPPDKTSYVEGQSLDLTGMVVTAHYNNGTSAVTSDYTTSPANGASLTPSNTTVTITYSGADIVGSTAPTVSQAITVTAKAVDSIEITTSPSKTSYVEGQSFDSSGMVITVHYNDSSTGTINSDYASKGVTFTPNGALSTSDNAITVSYSGKTVTQAITVSERQVSSITVKTPPDDVNYTEGEALDLTGLVVEAHYNNGTSAITSDFTASPADGTALSTLDTAVTITYNGTDIEGATAPTVTQAIVVAGKKVSSITVKTPPTKTSYVEGQTLDLTGMLIEAHYNNGTSEITTDFTVSPAEGASLTPSNTAVTITYDGADIVGTTAPTVSQAITVTAKAIDSIEIRTPPSKTDYIEGQSFDSSGMVITVHYNDSSTGTINSDYESKGVTFTPNGALSKTDTTITVSYSGKTVNQAITVSERQVSGITVKTPPDKTSYVEGQTLDLTGMVVEAHYNDGTSAITSDFTASPANGETLQTSDTQVTVTYNGADITGATAPTVTQAISVVAKAVTGISITPPTTVDYVEGQSFNPDGMVITVSYNDGSSKTINSDYASKGVTFTPNGALSTTDTSITVEYEGKTATQAITVSKKQVSSITVKTPPDKTSYIEGQSLDLTGMVVEAHYNDGTSKITDDYTTSLSNGATLTAEDTAVKITYAGTDIAGTNAPTTTQAITVTAKVVDSIQITTPPTSVAYIEGQKFNPEGMIITVNYNDGTHATINNDYASKGVTFTPETALSTADTSVTVKYREKTVSQAITVIPDTVTDITIKVPSQLTYNYGDKIDLTNATITKVWASGIAHENDTIPMTKEMLSNTDISNFDNMNSIGTKKIDVMYAGVTKTNAFQVTINDYIESIEIEDKSRLQKDYEYGDTINLTDKDTKADLYVLVKYAGGTPDDKVKLASSMVSGFNMNKVQNNQTVTVTHAGKTDTFTINVKDKVTGIEITSKPKKKVYKLNEPAEFADIVVKDVMKSGAVGATLTNAEYTLSALDTASVGEKTITVTKVGTSFTDTFKVKVIDGTLDMYISALPKQDYLYGQTLSLAEGKITVKTQTNPTGIEIPMTDASVKVTGYNKNKLNEQTLTVTYTYTEETETGMQTKTMTDTYTVTVEDYWAGAIEVIAPNKKQYKYNQELDLTGAKVGKVMASGAKGEKQAITGEMISGYDCKKEGKQLVTVTYAGKTGTFEVTVVDEVVGISMNTKPNKTEYTKGEKLDLTGATINVTKISGTTVIPVTSNMISGYNPNKTGIQVITVACEGQKTEFAVNVKAPINKPDIDEPTNNKPVDDNKPVNKPSKKPNINKPTNNNPVEVSKPVDEPIQEPIQTETPKQEIPKQEKPTETLGVKDEETSDKWQVNKMAVGIGASGILLLLLLLVLKRNTKVYVFEDGEFVLGGKAKISKNKPSLDIDKFLDEDTYPNKVKICLNDKISEDLDGKEIEIKHRGKTFKHKVKYQDKEYEFILN